MQSFPLSVLVFLLFGKRIYIFVAYHNKSCYGYYYKPRITGYIQKVRHSVPGCSYRIDECFCSL